MTNQTVFLDRDDTISRDIPYCSRPEDFELLPAAGEGVKLLNDADFRIVIITNQSGIARGYFSEEMLGKIHQKMRDDLAQYGAHIDAIYFCPHHPDDNCDCRKPKPKLVYQAVKKLAIDLKRSYVIGDRLTDLELARNIGCKSAIIPSAPGKAELENSSISPDYAAPDFISAAKWVIRDNKASQEGRASEG